MLEIRMSIRDAMLKLMKMSKWMKKRRLIPLCACLILLAACGRQPEQVNDGVRPRNLTEEQAAGERAGTENGLAAVRLPYQTAQLTPLAHPESGAREAMVWTIDQAEEEEIAAAQAFLDSLSFETADYSQWVGGDLARAMEGEYCLLEIDAPRYFVCAAPCHPELARVSVTARLSQTQPGQSWTAWYRTDPQASENLLALIDCRFEDWETVLP